MKRVLIILLLSLAVVPAMAQTSHRSRSKSAAAEQMPSANQFPEMKKVVDSLASSQGPSRIGRQIVCQSRDRITK